MPCSRRRSTLRTPNARRFSPSSRQRWPSPFASFSPPPDELTLASLSDQAAAGIHAVTADPESGMAGRWRLHQELGAGGMGQVFYATRREAGDGTTDHAAYEQRAAIKVLWSHQTRPETMRRFFRERRILAELDHPGLARFLDGGLSRRRPPLVRHGVCRGQSTPRTRRWPTPRGASPPGAAGVRGIELCPSTPDCAPGHQAGQSARRYQRAREVAGFWRGRAYFRRQTTASKRASTAHL